MRKFGRPTPTIEKTWDDYETARNITYQLEGGEQYEMSTMY